MLMGGHGQMGRRARWMFAVVPVLMMACSSAEPEREKQYVYDPYSGDAYPNHRPPLVIPGGGMGVVSDSRSDTLSFIDLDKGERFATYPVGRDPVTIDGPHHVVVDQSGGFVYVALSYPFLAGATGPHAGHGSAVVPGYVQQFALSDLSLRGQVRVDSNPGDIVISDDGKRVLVSHFDLQRAINNPGYLEAARATVAVISPETLASIGSPDPLRIPVCIAPHGVALSRPDGARAFVACYGEDSLAIVDIEGGGLNIKRIDVGADATPYNPVYGPYAAVLSPDASTIAVSNTISKDVRFFDVAAESFDLAKNIKTVGAPYFSAYGEDGARLYLPTQMPDELYVIDVLNGNAVITSRSFTQADCIRPHVVAAPAGGALFLVCEGDWESPGRVLKLDAATLDTIGAAEVGVYPDGFFVVPGAVP